MNEVCENCGLPADAVSGLGYKLTVEVKPENTFQRASRRTVWCHDRECAVQTLAIARFGLPTCRWPITLAQFRSLPEVQELISRSECTETIAGTRINTGAPEALNEKVGLPHQPPISVRLDGPKTCEQAEARFPCRKGGRPKKWNSEAQRLRAYRDRPHSRSWIKCQ